MDVLEDGHQGANHEYDGDGTEIALPCTHRACRTNSHLQDTKAFRKMSVPNCLTAVGSIIYVITGQKGNKIFGNKKHNVRVGKRQKQFAEIWEDNEFQTCASILHAAKGKHLSQLAFFRSKNVSTQTIACHAKLMSFSPSFSLYKSKLGTSRLCRLRPHPLLVHGFLNCIFEH